MQTIALSTTTTRGAWVGAAFAVLAIAGAFAADLPVQRVASLNDPPGVVRDYFKATETFGNGFGVVMIVMAVVVLDPTRRVQTSRLLAASLGAGLAADVVKLCVARTRPHAFAAGDGTVLDTFTGWFPLVGAGSAGQSFPSAHTACAFGLAAALAMAYPAGRRLFYALALGVAAQRVFVGAHYLSDVIIGGLLGVFWAHAVCRAGMMGNGFDRMEAWWARRFGWPLPEGHGSLDSPPMTIPVRAPAVAARRAA